MKEVGDLIEIMEQVAKGRYSDDIMAYTRPERPEPIRRMAEAMGMMMVKIEAREQHLENLVSELSRLNSRMKENAVQTVAAVARALEARDEYSRDHTLRVAHYAQRLALRMGLSGGEVDDIAIGGLLHDIGKIGFSDAIFQNEDTRPSKEMYEEIKMHPEIGSVILESLDFLGKAREYVLYHHERLDGTGYPFGLKGDEIPLGAQVLAVADCFDAITTDRKYQKGVSREEGFAILRKLAQSALSARLVKLLIRDVEEKGMALDLEVIEKSFGL